MLKGSQHFEFLLVLVTLLKLYLSQYFSRASRTITTSRFLAYFAPLLCLFPGNFPLFHPSSGLAGHIVIKVGHELGDAPLEARLRCRLHGFRGGAEVANRAVCPTCTLLRACLPTSTIRTPRARSLMNAKHLNTTSATHLRTAGHPRRLSRQAQRHLLVLQQHVAHAGDHLQEGGGGEENAK